MIYDNIKKNLPEIYRYDNNLSHHFYNDYSSESVILSDRFLHNIYAEFNNDDPNSDSSRTISVGWKKLDALYASLQSLIDKSKTLFQEWSPNTSYNQETLIELYDRLAHKIYITEKSILSKQRYEIFSTMFLTITDLFKNITSLTKRLSILINSIESETDKSDDSIRTIEKNLNDLIVYIYDNIKESSNMYSLNSNIPIRFHDNNSSIHYPKTEGVIQDVIHNNSNIIHDKLIPIKEAYPHKENDFNILDTTIKEIIEKLYNVPYSFITKELESYNTSSTSIQKLFSSYSRSHENIKTIRKLEKQYTIAIYMIYDLMRYIFSLHTTAVIHYIAECDKLYVVYDKMIKTPKTYI